MRSVIHVIHWLLSFWPWLKENAAPVEAVSGVFSVAAVAAMGWLSWRASNRTLNEMVAQRRLAVAPSVRFVRRHSSGDIGEMLARVKMPKEGYRPKPLAYVFDAVNVGAGPAIDLRVVKINGQEPSQANALHIDGHHRLTVLIWTHDLSPNPIIVEAQYYDLLGETHAVPKVKITHAVNAAIVEQLTETVT